MQIYQVSGPVERFAGQIASQGYICACPSSFHEFEGPEALPYDTEGPSRVSRSYILSFTMLNDLELQERTGVTSTRRRRLLRDMTRYVSSVPFSASSNCVAYNRHITSMLLGCYTISGRPLVLAPMYWADRCYRHVLGRTFGEFCLTSCLFDPCSVS
jgi:hypothetical protein